MKRRIEAFVWIVVMALALGGCSLAREDKEAAARGDRFVGVNVAVMRMDGVPSGSRSYELENLESYIGLREEKDPDTGDVSVGVNSGTWSTEPNSNVNIRDITESAGKRDKAQREETYSMTAVVNMAVEGGESSNVGWRLDPVYRREDGTLYVPEFGNAMAGAIDATTQKKSETYEILNDEGEKVQRTVEISVTMQLKTPIERATVYEMSAENEILARHALDFDAIEKAGWTMTVSKDAAWLLIEKDEDGKATRSICEFSEGDGLARCGFLRPVPSVSLPEGCTALGIRTLTIARGE